METHAIHPLKAYRDSQIPPLSQEDLARQLGTSKGTVSRWESGERKPDVEQLPTISVKTGIPPGKLRPDLAALFFAANKLRRTSSRRRKARVNSRAA